MLRLTMLSSLLAALCLVAPVLADIPGDLVGSFPVYGPTKTKQYSGYIAADDAKTVFLHYWFVTSPNPTKDPVSVWMNGGPGCSSLLGATTELGPYSFNNEIDNKTGIPIIVDNPNAWSTVSNVLFIEQPAGVGFSYAVNGSLSSDDYIQSQNTYGFLLNFFKAFPEFAANDFYITGESYAGIYVPTLANRVVMGNAAGNPKINLKGIAVGNGCWGSEVGTCSSSPDSDRIQLTLFKGHSMIPQKMWDDLIATCGVGFNSTSSQCSSLISEAQSVVGDIDVYNVYDTCPGDNANRKSVLKNLKAPVPAVEKLRDPVTCIGSDLPGQWLDNKDVRKALHVQDSSVPNWQECANLDYNSNLPDERPMYAELIKNIRVLIFNGDADSCVPWIGNYEWVRSMNIPETNSWSPWMVNYQDRQWTGGFVVDYGSNFSFLTIKHAGHMVAQYEPEAALTFYTNFIQNKPW